MGRFEVQVGVVLEAFPDGAFVQHVDGSLVAANSHFHRIYGHGKTTTGRKPDAFLSLHLLEIFQHSDALIKRGCAYVLFEHTLEPDSNSDQGSAREMLLRTIKVSLLGSTIAGWLCIGLTRQLKLLPPDRCRKIRHQWQRYEMLPTRERQCFQLLGQGKKTSDIATELDIDPKTANRIRDRLAEQFDLQDNVEFTHLCVRFHDAGFSDFGLKGEE